MDSITCDFATKDEFLEAVYQYLCDVADCDNYKLANSAIYLKCQLSLLINSNTTCCGTPGHPITGWCYDCHDEVCSYCAAVWEREDGYGDDGRGVRTFALCRPCQAIRDERRQRREARNDSGV